MKIPEVWVGLPNVDELAEVSNLGHLRLLKHCVVMPREALSYNSRERSFGWYLKCQGQRVFVKRSDAVAPFLDLGITVAIDTSEDAGLKEVYATAYVDFLEDNAGLNNT